MTAARILVLNVIWTICGFITAFALLVVIGEVLYHAFVAVRMIRVRKLLIYHDWQTYARARLDGAGRPPPSSGGTKRTPQRRFARSPLLLCQLCFRPIRAVALEQSINWMIQTLVCIQPFTNQVFLKKKKKLSFI